MSKDIWGRGPIARAYSKLAIPAIMLFTATSMVGIGVFTVGIYNLFAHGTETLYVPDAIYWTWVVVWVVTYVVAESAALVHPHYRGVLIE